MASRLHDLTKEYDCQLIVSETVGVTAGISLGGFARHEVQVRGLSAPLAIRVIDSAAKLARYEAVRAHETSRGGDPAGGPAPALAT